MKILVTGGAGFIGSHLCERLLQDNHEVICLDNFITGRKENIEELLKNPKFSLIEADVTQQFNNLTIEQLSNLNLIFHLASPASPVDYQKYPIETLMTNSLGTYNMLELVRKTQSRFLFASTSEVYGDPQEHPQKETYWGHANPVGPRACYDEAKRFAEALCVNYQTKFNLDVRIVRIFNTYGPEMRVDDGRVISTFINQALANKPMTVFGKGKQTRSFCFISDMIEGLVKAMTSNQAKGEIFNLGSPMEVEIITLAKLIKKLTNSQSKVKFEDLPTDDPARRQPDIAKAKNILDWQPMVRLEEGLKKTISYYESR